MKKKLMILVLACAMILTACGTEQTDNNGNNQTPSAGSDVTESSGTANSTETSDSAEEKPTEDSKADASGTEGGQTEETKTEDATQTSETDEVQDTSADFASVLKDLHRLSTYEEREAYVATLDKSKYSVKELENADLVTHANGTAMNVIHTYDMGTADYIYSEVPGSELYYPSFDDYTLASCANIDMYSEEENAEMPTGDVTLMALTNLSTGETDPWGVKIYKAGRIIVETENEYGWTYEEYVVDPNSPVTTAYCTIEELVNEKNSMVDDGYTHDIKVTRVEPIYAEEMYDEEWNPTGEYLFYEVYRETRYAEESELEVEQWGDQTNYYYCDEDGNYWNAYKDDNGKFYYNFEKVVEVPVKERGYTVAFDDNWGTYVVDENGNVVMGEDTYIQEATDPMIATWDTIKYYSDIYNPRFWRELEGVVSFRGEYSIVDMKPEDYSYVAAEDFDSLIQNYLSASGIELDEEVIAIRASIPEAWGWEYEDYHDKIVKFGRAMYNEETNDYTIIRVTFDRKDNWYIYNGYNVAVRDDAFSTSSPVCEVSYSVSSADTEGDSKSTAVNFLVGMTGNKTEEDVVSFEVEGKPVYYLEDQFWSDERYIYVLQDIGLERFVQIDISTYDMTAEAGEYIKQFLAENYSVERTIEGLEEE